MFSDKVWVQQGDQFIKATVKNNSQYIDEEGKSVNGSICERTEQVVEDMINLNVLNDPQLLYNIEKRYYEDKIFTYVGPTLLVVNPFKFMPGELKLKAMYIQEIIRNETPYKTLAPHTFSITAHAFTQLPQKNQAIVISGESGAGKTENARYCMNLLTAVNSKEDELSGKIIGCNPILESFGNAKTVRNKNSSRFGKYCRLMVDQNNIIGADIINYLLEKSRVISQSKNNRNFHIFYLFLNGVKDLQKYEIMQNQQFQYLPKSDFQFTNKMYEELIDAFNTVGIDYEKVFNVVAAILLIGELQFDDKTYGNDTPCTVEPRTILEGICSLLNVNVEEISKALTMKMAIYGKEKILSPLKKIDCYHIRDSWAKELYETLFCWIVGQLNNTLSERKSQKYIGLLDIYGFEVFDDGNGFEQMMINYSNERLHQLYIEYVFKEERKFFVAEGLGHFVDRIQFEDNTGIIDLFDKPQLCVFNLIDQACKLNQSDQQLLNTFRKELKFPAKGMKPIFVIKHTAKDVEYTCAMFVEKNMDETPALLLECKSTNPMISFEVKPKSICQKIKKEIKDLMGELSECGVHFIRCIKPNDEQCADKLERTYALKQIRYLGVLDSLKVRRDSYPVRVDYKRFHSRYGDYTRQEQPDFKALSQALLTQQFKLKQEDYLFGNTQIFMQESCLKQLDQLYAEKMKQKILMATKIQRAYRCYRFTKAYKKMMRMMKKMKQKIMRFKKRMEFRKRLQAAKVIKIYYREYQVMKKQKLFRKQIDQLKLFIKTYSAKQQWMNTTKSIVAIQRAYRCHNFRKMLSLRINVKYSIQRILDRTWTMIRNKAAIIIQKYYRGHHFRQTHKKEIYRIKEVGRQIRFQKKVKMIQKWARGHIVRMRLKKMHQAAYYIQGYFRMRFLSDIFQRMRMAAVYIQRRFRECMPKRRKMKEQYLQFIQPMEQQFQQQKIIEEQDLYGFQTHQDYDSTLSIGQESQIVPKIYLFSFILDLEILQDTSDCYEPTFAFHYRNLFLKLFQKENPIQQIHVGDTFAFVVSSTKLYCWGLNDLNQLGEQPDGEIHPPKQFNFPGKLKQISLGSNHGIILNDDKAYMWGNCEKGRVQHPVLISEQVQQIKAMRDKFYFVKMNGTLYEHLKLVRMDQKVQRISCGMGFIMILCEGGQLHSYGGNEHGQLGLGDKEKREHPQRVHINEKILQVECGLKHVICLSSLKKVYTWGWGEFGQLANSSLDDESLPINLQIFADQVMAGYRSSCVLKKQVFWAGTNGTILLQTHFAPIVNKCHYLTRKEYIPVRILCTHSKNISITYTTYACHKGVFDTNHSKALKVCSTITSKWIENDIHTLEPPFIESVSNYICEKHQIKNLVKKQKLFSDISLKEKRDRIQDLNNRPRDKWSREDFNFVMNFK